MATSIISTEWGSFFSFLFAHPELTGIATGCYVFLGIYPVASVGLVVNFGSGIL